MFEGELLFETGTKELSSQANKRIVIGSLETGMVSSGLEHSGGKVHPNGLIGFSIAGRSNQPQAGDGEMSRMA